MIDIEKFYLMLLIASYIGFLDGVHT